METGNLLIIGGKYNWKNQPERLVYLGLNWSGNGYWHQFALIENPEEVWCEVLDSDLHMLEETIEDSDSMKSSKAMLVTAIVAASAMALDAPSPIDYGYDSPKFRAGRKRMRSHKTDANGSGCSKSLSARRKANAVAKKQRRKNRGKK